MVDGNHELWIISFWVNYDGFLFQDFFYRKYQLCDDEKNEIVTSVVFNEKVSLFEKLSYFARKKIVHAPKSETHISLIIT